ncbi:Elongator complex protein 4 [Grifola frondosa]|uniref:Elongator complex protein 4 n=1 Tax=Grifola frondosa TaxID=5627 RepID=A0A1C7MQD7_GRIFR|nr:Elongator complex protein 4 [Grifola frondosa]
MAVRSPSTRISLESQYQGKRNAVVGGITDEVKPDFVHIWIFTIFASRRPCPLSKGERPPSKHPLTCTRASPGSISTIITSTGIPSLDDILGGGLPLSCSLLVLAPDAHSAYGELVLKYFAAQGLACGQKLCVIEDNAEGFLSECMWMPGVTPTAVSFTHVDDEEDEKTNEQDTKIKIAWRYEQMKQFQTTVPTSNHCASACSHLLTVNVSSPESSEPPCRRIIRRVTQFLSDDVGASKPIRICIPALGSSEWGDLAPPDIYYFLHSLRALCRRYPHACAAVCLPPHLCAESWGGPGWIQKLGWLSDTSITLSAFTANPSLTAIFSSHHGLVHIHSLPAPHTLLPPSDKFSTLRGLSSSGENNLAFKCMRKRLVFETLHLDVEGGVGERRTTPATNTMAFDTGVTTSHAHGPTSSIDASITSGAGTSSGIAAVEVQLEQVQLASTSIHDADHREETIQISAKKTKVKKRVAFTSDRPDLYDF